MGLTGFRIAKNRIFQGLIFFLSFVIIVPLFLIILHIVVNGISAINWQFLVSLPAPVGEEGGGIANAIVGTFMIIIISSILAIPVGVLSGIFLYEYRDAKLAEVIRVCVEVLMGVPSIVLGIIAYLWIVLTFGSFSALSGGIALAIMMLPVIIRSTEETLGLIPDTLREASLALGVPYYRTILKVIVPAGLSGILTGILLSVARIAGETAPLLFTSFGNPFMNLNIFKPTETLPHMIYIYATSPYKEWHTAAWGASFILVVFVLGLNIITKVIARR
jgi:phosphate transport system permease protein